MTATTSLTQGATAYFRSASNAKAKGDWAGAVAAAQRVLRLEPNHEGAQAIVDDGRRQASELYLRGTQTPNPKEALGYFRRVTQMTSPGDEVHEKAGLHRRASSRSRPSRRSPAGTGSTSRRIRS